MKAYNPMNAIHIMTNTKVTKGQPVHFTRSMPGLVECFARRRMACWRALSISDISNEANAATVSFRIFELILQNLDNVHWRHCRGHFIFSLIGFLPRTNATEWLSSSSYRVFPPRIYEHVRKYPDPRLLLFF